MIRANVTEIKNRLSHYLRLVKGGEEVEIIGRNTPLARMVAIGNNPSMDKSASWVQEMYNIGILVPPKKPVALSKVFRKGQVTSSEGDTCGVLRALLEERHSGR